MTHADKFNLLVPQFDNYVLNMQKNPEVITLTAIGNYIINTVPTISGDYEIAKYIQRLDLVIFYFTKMEGSMLTVPWGWDIVPGTDTVTKLPKFFN